MIDEMRKLPSHVPIQQPIPRECCFENSVLFKQANAKRYHRYGNKAGDKTVGYKNEKRYAVVVYFKAFVNGCTNELDKQQKRNERRDGRKDTIKGEQAAVIAAA